MKKYLLIAGLMLFFIKPMQAQDDGGDKARRNNVKINVLSPFVSSFSGFYERGLSEKTSAQIGLFYTGYDVTGTSWNGYGITPEFRYYLSDNMNYNQGFYLGPFLRFAMLETKKTGTGFGEEPTALLNTIGGGAVAGYQFAILDRFSIDAFAGPALNFGGFRNETGSLEFDEGPFTGLNLRLGLAAGYRF